MGGRTEESSRRPFEQALGPAFTYCPNPALVLDDRGRVAAINPAAVQLTGWTPDELVGRRSCRSILPCPAKAGAGSRCELMPRLRSAPGVPLEAAWRGPDGRSGYAELTAAALPDSLIPGGAVFVLLRDTTGEQTRQRRLEELARTDALTGLGNRYRLADASHSLTVAGTVSTTIAMLDVDNMKTINDGLGHHIGDRVLQEIGALLQQHTRQSDIAVRYGGDEFVLLLPQTNLNQAQRLMRRIDRLMRDLGRFLDIPVPVSVSYGLAEVGPGERLEEALVRADKAMYRRKFRRRRQTPSGGAADGAQAQECPETVRR